MATVATLAAQRNRYKNKAGVTTRAVSIVVIDSNKSDTQYLPEAVRGFRVDVAGVVKFTTYDDAGALVDLTRNFAAGEVWDYATVVRVFNSVTTATGIDGII